MKRVIVKRELNGKVGMRIMVGLVPVLVVVVVVLWVKSNSSQIFLSTQLFGNPHFIFSIFNSIILLITVTHHEEPPHPHHHHQQFEIMELVEFSALDGGGQEKGNYDKDEDAIEEVNDQEAEDEGSDGELNDREAEDEDEDEPERCDAGEEEDDEDEELERRIEEFIAKVNQRWREEKLRDNFAYSNLFK